MFLALSALIDQAAGQARSLFQREDGQDAFEYMLIIGGVSVAVVIGVALLATVLIERTHAHTADAGLGASANAVAHAGVLGYHDAFFASAILGLIGLVFTLIIRDEDAAATMVRDSGETVSDVDEGSVVGLTVQNG